MEKVKLALYLSEWRQHRGMTVEGVGDRLGVHYTTVSRWETGRRAVNAAQLQQLADLYMTDAPNLYVHPRDAEGVRELVRVFAAITPDQRERLLGLARDLLPVP